MTITALGMAVFKGNLTMVRYLLAHGAQVNPPDEVTPPLLFAVQRKIHLIDGPTHYSQPITKSLLQAGANVDTYKNSSYFNREYIFPPAFMILSLDKKPRL
jgi:ankyrin repeat protein